MENFAEASAGCLASLLTAREGSALTASARLTRWGSLAAGGALCGWQPLLRIWSYQLQIARDRYNAVVNGWSAEGTLGIAYPALLVETYHYVRHSCALMDRARERLSDDFAALRDYLAVHRAEEYGHEQWLLDDLAALGHDRAAVAASEPLAETVALVGDQLYVIDFLHPAGLLGYVYVMESQPPTRGYLEQLHRDGAGCTARRADASGAPRRSRRRTPPRAQRDPRYELHRHRRETRGGYQRDARPRRGRRAIRSPTERRFLPYLACIAPIRER